MSLAPPVSRGNFYYNGSLYVEVGNSNRHKRATVEEITAILRPDLKKSNKACLNPQKDQVGHWYEAQLIHYGLPPSKDKARAKMRLLEALNSSRLVVPRAIAQMEAELEKEFAAAERKAKALHKASQAPPKKTQPVAGGRKRKQSETSGNNNTINVNINLEGDLQRLSSGGTIAENHSPAKKRPRQTARKPTTPSTSVNLAEENLPYPYNVNLTATDQEIPASRSRQTARKSTKSYRKPPAAKIKTEARVKKEPSTKPSSQIKHEYDTNRSPPPSSPSLGLINGLYELSCPTTEDEWGCQDLTLTLTLDGTTVWGAYDLGVFSGILHLPSRPWQASDDPLPFTWRGREMGEGMMSFEEACEGEITFLGNGYIKGWISVYGQCAFTGVRVPEAGTAVRPARDMRAEWEGYNLRAYEEENRARWR